MRKVLRAVHKTKRRKTQSRNNILVEPSCFVSLTLPCIAICVRNCNCVGCFLNCIRPDLFKCWRGVVISDAAVMPANEARSSSASSEAHFLPPTSSGCTIRHFARSHEADIICGQPCSHSSRLERWCRPSSCLLVTRLSSVGRSISRNEAFAARPPSATPHHSSPLHEVKQLFTDALGRRSVGSMLLSWRCRR